MSRRGRLALWLLLPVLAGCRQDMHDQPKLRGLRGTEFFADGRSARPLVPGTVSRDALHDDEHLYTGKVGGKFAETFPFPVAREVLERGRERFDIFCSPCHGRLGDGQGMVVRRGFPQPTSFHVERLRQVQAGYLFDVITNGFGRMQDYAVQVRPRDRWAIVAYIRALQLSQDATLADVPADERARLESEGEAR